MQTRDYDDYIYIPSSLGFRKINDAGNKVFLDIETDGYCNLYADNISISYLHNMNDFQVNAIHYFEENHLTIFKKVLSYLSNFYKNAKLELGFRHVNVLNDYKDDMCYLEYVFIDSKGSSISIKMGKDQVISSSL